MESKRLKIEKEKSVEIYLTLSVRRCTTFLQFSWSNKNEKKAKINFFNSNKNNDKSKI